MQKLSSNDDDSTRNRRSSIVDDSSKIPKKTSNEASCSPMIDIILVVHDAQQFHEKNIAKHSSHYSFIASNFFWSISAASVQNVGPGVYFNPYSTIAGFEVRTNQAEHSCSIILHYLFIFHFFLFSKVKYGVITKEKLLTDLLNWDYLYISGRMHKPTVCIGQGDDEILHAQKLNIKSALAASLLLLNVNQECNGGRMIPASEIFSSIAHLSYAGDFRMTLGAEDKNKVKKLVQSPGQYKRWVELYNPPLQNLRGRGILDLTERTDDNTFMVRCDLQDVRIRRELVNDLPKALQQKFYSSVDKKGSYVTREMLSSELVKIVSHSSRVQGIKGLFTAGISKSIKYSVAKFSKGILRK